MSLFTDMASEMLYPVMPIYLRAIGFSLLWIGILEGCAEAVAGLSKSYFGGMSDQKGRRLPFVQWGYALSALSKPMMGMFTWMWWVFSARTIDRLGKGIRTGARDAMLSDEADHTNKAAIFGFHRSMDTMGAVIGPALALLFLWRYPGQYRWLFFLAFIPGVLAVVSTRLIREKRKPSASDSATTIPKKNISLQEGFRYWKDAPAHYRYLVRGLLLFALFNSSDLLLLLKIRESGHPDTTIIGIYIFYNAVYALLAWPMGRLADRLGLHRIFLLGIFLFGLTYLGFALNNSFAGYLLLFLLYGGYAACTEGVSKAWISKAVPSGETATAIGTYTGFQSIAALIASSFAGWLWYRFGPAAAFLSTALVSGLVLGYFLIDRKQTAKS